MTRRHTFEDLINVMARLRGPGGCPWDQAQTPESLRPYLLEEAYEALEALDRQDPAAFREELGDVLLQIVFQAQMASESGAFTIDDVVSGLTQKLLDRHPHVFGEKRLHTPEAVKEHWETAKRAEGRGVFDGIPAALPALARAQKIQERVRGLGFRWPDVAAAVAKVRSELEELSGARGDQAAEELADVLFTVVNVAIFYGIDAEQALRDGTRKFISRFEAAVRLAEASGRPLSERSLEEMLELWNVAKEAAG